MSSQLKCPRPTAHVYSIAWHSIQQIAVATAGGILAFAAAATPPSGVISNVLIAQGQTVVPLKENVRVGDNWSVTLENKGQSEIFFQDLVVGPGGRTGWHTHPGFLLITVKDGHVDWYDQDCSKRRFSAGQSFTESEHSHNVLNPGSENARLLIVYIVKKGDPRRIESPQPTCGANLGLE